MKIVCFGPGPMFKGGIANYNTSLAKALDRAGHEVFILSWTQQYPAIIPRDFIDRKSRSNQLEGTGIKVEYLLNYNNPFSWKQTIRRIKELRPDGVIFQWSIAIQGLPLGFIARRLRRDGIKVLFDLHFVIQKEGSSLDRHFSSYALRQADMYVTHALKTYDELKALFPQQNFYLSDQSTNSEGKPVINLFHPVYDMFRPDPDFDVKHYKTDHDLKPHVFLFFGFIRKYKGLHNAIRAFKLLSDQRDDVSLLICGESFWNTIDKSKLSSKIKSAVFGLAKKLFLKKQDNEQDYRPLDLIDSLGIRDKVMVVNEFIPNEDVHKYFQVSDSVLLFYEYATPSGVESIAYNFNMPLLATAVGHFPETVKPGYNGYLATPGNIKEMAAIMEKSINSPIDRKNVAETTREMSWDNYAKAIINGLNQ
jgi:glycosyltransferase involved in cell wall biosynthesis